MKRWIYFVFFTTVVSMQWACAGGETLKACEGDDICGLGRICISRRCIEGCRRQDDCPEGQICFENRCGKQLCKPGQQVACYDGSDRTKGAGICREGNKFCLRDGTEWSACVQQLLPQQEVCDQADNDCDGQIDEGLSCECTPGSRRSCYHGSPETLQKGTCQAGIQYCENNHRWGKCHGQNLPQSEVCDQKDNNCNGLIDEWIVCDCQPGQTRECYTGSVGTDGKGSCKKGQQSCTQENRWGGCVGEVIPQLEENESCNGKDDDCDGVIDNRSGSSEPLKDFCYEGDSGSLRVGSPCREGIKTCKDGKWGECVGQQLPRQESCNGIDDDCDGIIDNGCQTQCKDGTTSECYPNETPGCAADGQGKLTCNGECRGGLRICQQGKWGNCVGYQIPRAEQCNGKDDNCDGQIDESACTASCVHGSTRTCYDATAKGCVQQGTNYVCQGVCRAGIQVCQGNVWGTCLFHVLPSQELCDGLDNNCDGSVDEAFPQLQKTCKVGKGLCERTGVYVCDVNRTDVVCNSQPGFPQTEVCDGKDNDCDGVIDNDCICVPTCPVGTECKKGQCIPIPPEPQPEPIVESLADIPAETTLTEAPTDLSGEPIDSTDSGPEIAPEPEIGPLPEGYVCYPGQTQPCYTGPSVTQQKGACQDGTQTCQSNGQWGSCVGQTIPTKEICDGLDNDCDGQVDEPPDLQGPLCMQNGNVCVQGGSCQQKPGVCTGATAQCLGILGWAKTCTVADYQRHSADYQTVEDRCDNLDNDCDGQIDENCPWAVGDSGGTNSIGQALAIDTQGNLYVAGSFSGTMILGGTTLQSMGNSSIFVTKVNPSGQFVWSIRAGGSSGDHQVTSMAVDPQGNLVLGGFFYKQATFGSITIQSFAHQTSSHPDGFVAKLSPQGQFLWAKSIGGTFNDYVRAVAVDAQSNVYVGGAFEGAMTFAAYTLQSASNTDTDVFIGKLDQTGKEIWGTSGGSAYGRDELFDIKVHSQGNVYVLGTYAGKGVFGTFVASDQSSSATMYVGKIEQSTGKWVSLVHAVGAGNVSVGRKLHIDSKAGDVFVTGYFGNSVTFGTFTVSSKGRSDIFVARLDHQKSQFSWAVGYGGNVDDQGQDLTMDKQGNLVVTGYFNSLILSFGSLSGLNLLARGGEDIFLVVLGTSDGKPISAKSAGGGGTDKALGVVADPFDNFYVTGIAGNKAGFGPHLLSGGMFLWQTKVP